MTTEAFDRRVAIYAKQDRYRRCNGCGAMTEHTHRLPNGDLVALCASCILDGEVAKLSGEINQEIGPHIVKIPLRVEYRALLQAAAAYEANAERLRLLAQQAREQAANLKSQANL